MEKQWNLTVAGLPYAVTFKSSIWSGKKRLIVNGQETIIKNKFAYDYVGMDVPVEIGGKECRLVMAGGDADLAVDGVFISSGEPYEPLAKMPKWNWIFIVACVAIFAVSGGGALPVLCAMLGAMFCTRVACSKKPLGAKIISCIGITGAAWLIWFVAAVALYAALY